MVKWLCLLWIGLLLVTWSQADIIVLKNGGRLEGKAAERGNEVHVTQPNGTMVIQSSDVKQIIRATTKAEVYQQLQSMLDPNDAEGHYQLALWCQENSLPQYHRSELRSVLLANPDHEKARTAMGYERYKERWVTKEEAMALQGYVQWQGRWMTPEEKQQTLAQGLQKELEQERQARERAEVRLAEAERRINWLEQELARINTYVQELAREVARPRYIVHKYVYPKFASSNEEKDNK